MNYGDINIEESEEEKQPKVFLPYFFLVTLIEVNEVVL